MRTDSRTSTGSRASGVDRRPRSGNAGIIDAKLAKRIAAAAALAGNAERRLMELIAELTELGVSPAEIHEALEIGQAVKERPARVMREAADLLAGTLFLEEGAQLGCPARNMPRDTEYTAVMLIAAGAAMAANCEPCLNKAVPSLIESGACAADIRRAVEIGQEVKDQAAAAVWEMTEQIAGARLAG